MKIAVIGFGYVQIKGASLIADLYFPEACMIENGKVTYPVKGATLIGTGPQAMNQVKIIGNDIMLDSGVGICGKEGQSVPGGQPTLRIDGLTVGGTAG